MPPKEIGNTDIQECVGVGIINLATKLKNLLLMFGHAVSCHHITTVVVVV